MHDEENEPLLGRAAQAELPRWIQISVGIALGLLTTLCGLASIVLLFPDKDVPNPIFARVVGVILLVGCLWLLEKCFRLVTGRKRKGGLLSPNVLRIVAVCMLILPVTGLFYGVLPGDEGPRDFAGSDVCFRFLWTSRISGKTRGRS